VRGPVYAGTARSYRVVGPVTPDQVRSVS